MQNLTKIKSDETIIYSSYSPSPQIKVGFSTKGRTKQSFKAECDINQILARFLKTGVLDFVQKNKPRYGDVTGLDYQSAVLKVAGAKTMFNELPSQLRARFDNDPGTFLSFIEDERNLDEAVELGLLKRREAPQANAKAEPLPPSHREDGSATHEPLRARDGTFREHTRAEKRAEKAATKAAEPSEPQAD